ncbi:hypothetical protein [Pseudomonas sp. FEN]|nr:hypothetical protein [Pseudomonas sp. FEN]
MVVICAVPAKICDSEFMMSIIIKNVNGFDYGRHHSIVGPLI